MSKNTQRSLSSSRVLIDHCNTIKQKGIHISTQELTVILDDLFREKHQIKTNLDNILPVLILVSPSTLAFVIHHQFFTLLRAPLIELITKWHRMNYLNVNEIFTFRKIISLIRKLLKNIRKVNQYPSWLFDSTLLKIISTCLTSIAKSDRFLNNKNRHESIGFIRLFNIYVDYQKGLKDEISSNQNQLNQLIDSIVHCLTSQQYIDLFDMIHIDDKTRSVRAKLFLHKFPSFLTSYNGSRLEQIMHRLLSTMLPSYQTLFNKLIPRVYYWKWPIIQAVEQLIKLINHGPTNAKFLAGHIFFIDHMLTLVNTPSLFNNALEKSTSLETNLITTVVTFLANMINEPVILGHIKQKKMTPSFLRLTSARNKSLVYSTYEILARITTEEDINKMRNPDALLSTVIKSLKTIVIDGKGENNHQVQKLFEILKGLTQHDQIKESLVKQGTLSFLLECINKLSGEPLRFLLETLWSLSFFPEAAVKLRTHKEFLNKVQTISNSTKDEALKKASDGLVWKLETEPAFLEKTARRQKETENTEQLVERTEIIIGSDGKEQKVTKMVRISVPPAEKKFENDIMISYCHADKDLVYKIHEYLLEQGFKIWIDRNHMFGPAMNAMAEAVENSEFVLLCMSDSYKQSTYCQAEAEYAFGCKRRLIPLIIRPNYKADGWLGFMIGARIYVDFGKFDVETACGKLMHEIALQRKQPLSSKPKVVVQDKKPVEPALTTRKSNEKPPTPIRTSSDKYLNRKTTPSFNLKPMYHWKSSDVSDFLYNHRLYEIMPLCEKMDGPAFIQLYKMCASHSGGTFNILNNELQSTNRMKLSIGTFTRFLSVMDRLVTPAPTPLPPSIPVLQPPPIPAPPPPRIASASSLSTILTPLPPKIASASSLSTIPTPLPPKIPTTPVLPTIPTPLPARPIFTPFPLSKSSTSLSSVTTSLSPSSISTFTSPSSLTDLSFIPPTPSIIASTSSPSIPFSRKENRSSAQSYAQKFNSPYDIVITSNATMPRLYQMVKDLVPQINARGSIHQKRTFYYTDPLLLGRK